MVAISNDLLDTEVLTESIHSGLPSITSGLPQAGRANWPTTPTWVNQGSELPGMKLQSREQRDSV